MLNGDAIRGARLVYGREGATIGMWDVRTYNSDLTTHADLPYRSRDC
jgi:hypothetical protein